MADNRADFVSQLFSRKRPPDLDAKTSASGLLAAYKGVQRDAKYQQQNFQTIKSVLSKHRFMRSDEDLQTIEGVHAVFYRAGPSIVSRVIFKPARAGPQLEFPRVGGELGNTSVVSRVSDLQSATRADGRLPSYLDLLTLLKDPYGSAGLGN